MAQKFEIDLPTIAKGFVVLLGLLGVTAFVPNSQGDTKQRLDMHIATDSIDQKHMNETIEKVLESLDKLNTKIDTLNNRSLVYHARNRR